MKENQRKSLDLIADSIQSGYSSLFTYAVKETLTAEEREDLSKIIRNLANESKGL